MEIAGEVVEAKDGGKQLKGARVMALLSGGGYAEYVAVHKSLVLKIPDNLSTNEAAGIMEAFLTGWQALVWLGELKSADKVLIHAGASGVGTACIQLSKVIGAAVLTTASGEKHDICYQLGADCCIDYQSEVFEAVVSENYPGGVNLVIDFIGAPYFDKNLASLAVDGKLVMLGLLGGSKAVGPDLAPILYKRLKVLGSTLRSRSLDYRSRLIEDFRVNCYQHLENGRLKPVIDKIFPWTEVNQAHQYMEENKNRGKVILEIK